MKNILPRTAALLAALPLATSAVVITNDTTIRPEDFTCEYADLIVSNATLTVDGPHTFASLFVGPGGAVTHTFSANGTIATNRFITDEPQILVSTNEVTLASTNIIPASVIVKDLSGAVTYQTNVDFIVRNAAPDTFLSRSETSTIPDGAMVLVSYGIPGGTIPAGLNLTVTQQLHVAVGGAIHANGLGLTSGSGSGTSRGSPITGSGAGHGGYGGLSSSNASGGNCVGFFGLPTNFGSRGGTGVGGAGGAGGGVIKLEVAGTAQIDGSLSADALNATNSRAGGGSGGSIWLMAQTLTGAGTITARGGNGEPIHGGGGGGGRIALLLETNLFAGQTTAPGGLGFKAGGAGTIFTKIGADAGTILLDNQDRTGTNSLIANPNQADVIIQRGAGVLVSGSWFTRDLVVESNSFLGFGTSSPVSSINSTSVFIAAGGVLSADALNGGVATGLGGFYAGGGHGGAGGNAVTNSNQSGFGGQIHGSQTNPNSGGGPGGGNPQFSQPSSFGGGIIRVIADRVEIAGRVSARGQDNLIGGGGAGGSIWITAREFDGAGTISADGGNGNSFSGGGGGGRIAVYTTSTNRFIGQFTAKGGGGANRGGAGTVYLDHNDGTNVARRVLRVDNGGFAAPNARTNTLLAQITTNPELMIQNGAAAQLPFVSTTVSGLVIGTNSSLLLVGPLTVTSNALIMPGGRLHADGVGFSTLGTGLGTSVGTSIYYCGGGGHGGYGGNGGTNNARGGNSFGVATAPTSSGSSGGGSGSSFSPFGGAGGGALRLTVNNALTNNGIISAAGLAGAGSFAGGGAGGSVYLSGGLIYGTGTISANGGPGLLPGGGGGGGGRIAVVVISNFFAGPITAFGGSGANYGGAGTIYLATNNSTANLIVNNNGNAGTNTTVGDTSFFGDITIQDGGTLVGALAAFNIRNITIRTNGTLLTAASPSQQTLTLTGELTIDSGGALSLDGRGNGAATGSGPGYSSSSSPRGGGGHGGYGGANPALSTYGGAYGAIVVPTTAGSGGGSASGTSVAPLGGAGGGALRIQLLGNSRVITVNGRLSADGLAGDNNSGGGSGGSIQFSTFTLAGSGVISANGGAGNGTAGGGGGGRIAISYSTNLFTGNIIAAGGTGAVAGGAGTVYLKPNSAATGTLIIDNAGIVGTNTPLASTFSLPPSPFDLIIADGATVFANTPLPQLSNLVINPGGLLTTRVTETNVAVNAIGNVTIAAGGDINVAGNGFGRALGPGPGGSLASKGAGGGHGGAGGNSQSGASGGTNYGSAMQPVLRGSGGGMGANTYDGGCEGGGAVRLTVGGTLALAGSINANGADGRQDDSGGGAGGSIWITAGRFIGDGILSATGGAGDLFGGGGGGGGRIAIYALTNEFTGNIAVTGGSGFAAGQEGTLFISTNLTPLINLAGTIRDTNGQPIAGVILQATSPGITNATAVTDINGNYALAVVSGWLGNITPNLPPNDFLPSSRSYNTTINSLNGQNFTMVTSVKPTLSSALVGTNLQINWAGISGVQYWLLSSTNLTAWQPIAGPINGSNGVTHSLQFGLDAPEKFFRIEATY